MTDAPPDSPLPAPDEEPMKPMVPRPIEASAVHYRAHGRCYCAFVVDVDAEDPLSPDFTVDVVIFAPRDKHRRDRFTDPRTLPGATRWANELRHALPEPDGHWQESTWHYPGRHCLPEVVLRGAQS